MKDRTVDYMYNDIRKEDYLQMKRKYHFELGLRCIPLNPLLVLMLLLNAVLFGFVFMNINHSLDIKDVPQIFNDVWLILCRVICVLMYIISFVGIVTAFGNHISNEDELYVAKAFPEKELVKCPPIVVSKRTFKNGKTKRVFHSLTEYAVWQDREQAIYDELNEHPTEPLKRDEKYKGKGVRIVLNTAPERVPKNKGDIYDDDV